MPTKQKLPHLLSGVSQYRNKDLGEGEGPAPFLESVPGLGPSAGWLQENKWKMEVYECSVGTRSTLSAFEKCIFNETVIFFKEWTAESASQRGKCNICASQNYTMWETIEKNVDYDLVFHISGPLSNQYVCLHGYYGAFKCIGAESGSSAPRMLPKSAHQGLNWNAWGIQLKRKADHLTRRATGFDLKYLQSSFEPGPV